MKFKANKLGRGIYMRLLAKAIKDPDEIWLMWGNDTEKRPLRRRYIKIFENTDGSHCLTVFEKDKEQWRGVTTFPARTGEEKQIKDEYVNEQRNGFLAYKKRQAK